MTQKVRKFIIKNESNTDDISCMSLVISVMKEGRISNNNKQYCYVCVFDNYVVFADVTRNKTDVFTVRNK
jgi:hypothetical protein